MDGFADPWEHVRLLADRARTDALLTLLSRRAPDARVVEVGCGTGVLACAAAKLGATHVLGVEETELAEVARELVRVNRLQGSVEIVHAPFEEVEPRSVDLVFSELLNVDPFAEGLLEVSRAATRWLGPDGILAPRRLEVWAGLVTDAASAEEHARCLAVLDRVGRAHGLRLDPVRDLIDDVGPYAYVSAEPRRVGAAACLYAADLRDPPEPDEVEVRVDIPEAVRVGGVALWFVAELDEGLVLANPPTAPGHWGCQVQAWSEAVDLKPGAVTLRAEPDGSGFEVRIQPDGAPTS